MLKDVDTDGNMVIDFDEFRAFLVKEGSALLVSSYAERKKHNMAAFRGSAMALGKLGVIRKKHAGWAAVRALTRMDLDLGEKVGGDGGGPALEGAGAPAAGTLDGPDPGDGSIDAERLDRTE